MAPYASMMDNLTPLTPEQAAEALVRAYCHWHVAPVVTETLTIDGNGRHRLQLPSLRVVDLTGVTVTAHGESPAVVVDPSAYMWSADGMLTRTDGARWPDRYRALSVTLQHGHEPGEVAWIVQQIADRVKLAPDGAAVIAGITTGAKSLQYRAFAGATGLMAGEREALAPYVLDSGAAA